MFMIGLILVDRGHERSRSISWQEHPGAKQWSKRELLLTLQPTGRVRVKLSAKLRPIFWELNKDSAWLSTHTLRINMRAWVREGRCSYVSMP